MIDLDARSGECPNCEKASGFSTQRSMAQVWPDWPIGGSQEIHAQRVALTALRCLYCEKSVIVLRYIDGGEVEQVIVAPRVRPRSLPTSVPAEVRGLFEEASECENVGALRGAGVLYRAALEEMVKERGATGRTLFEKIDSLTGRLNAEVIRDFHEVRMLGNDSIHAGIIYSAEEVADVAELIVEAVTEIYVQPAQRAAMRQARVARRSTTP